MDFTDFLLIKAGLLLVAAAIYGFIEGASGRK